MSPLSILTLPKCRCVIFSGCALTWAQMELALQLIGKMKLALAIAHGTENQVKVKANIK